MSDAILSNLIHSFEPGSSALTESRMLVESLLWRAQLVHWPDSRRVDLHEVITVWTDPVQGGGERVWRQLALCLHHPAIVFYECGTYPGGGRYRGARYGVEGPDYVSNFRA